MAMALHQARARSDHEVAAAGDQQRFDHSVTEAICRRPLRERSSDRWAASPRPHDKHHPLSAYMDMTWAMGRWSIGLGRSRIGSTRDEPPADTGRSSIIPATPRNRTDRTPASPSKSAGMDADGGPRGVAVAGAAVLPLYVDALRRDDSSAGEEVAGQGSSSAIELRLLLLTDDPGPRAQPSPPPLSPLAPSPLTSATGAAAVTSATGGAALTTPPPLPPPLPLAGTPPLASPSTSLLTKSPLSRMDPWTESNVAAVASSSATTGGAFRGGGASGGSIKSSHAARQWSRTDWPPRLRLVLDRRDKRADGPSTSST